MFGPIAALIGYLTNNALLISMVPTVSAYIVAILSVGFLEEVFTGSIRRIDSFVINMLKFLGWLVKTIITNSLIAYLILAGMLALFLIIPRITPDIHAKACLQPPLPWLCGSGIGIAQISIDNKGQISQNGSILDIGVIDEENTRTTFDQYEATNATEKDLADKIAAENQFAEHASKHFTLAVMTTLSRTVTDNGFSASVGLEDLRGAYVAQYYYNQDPAHKIKLKLLVANMGVKFATPITAPLVAQQVALFARNAADQEHFMGVTSLPFSVSAIAALPIFQQYGIPVVSSSASSSLLSHKQGFHRIEPSDSEQNPSIEQFMQLLNPQRVAVVYDEHYRENSTHPDDAYSQSLGSSVLGGLGHVSSVKWSKDYSYYVGHPETIPLQDILNDKPDLLFFAGYPDDLSALKDQLKQLQHQKVPIPEMKIMGAQALYELGGYANDNYTSLYFTSFAYPDAQDFPEQVTFATHYKEQFEKDGHANEYGSDRITPHSALSYDAVTAFQAAVEKALKNSGDFALSSVEGELASIDFHGATGETKFSLSDDSSPQSDPTRAKAIYFLCVTPHGLTKKITAIIPYVPAAEPDLTVCSS